MYSSSEVTKKKDVPTEIFYEYNEGSGKYTQYASFKEFNDNKDYYTFDTTAGKYVKYNTYEFINPNIKYYNNNNFNLSTHWTTDLEYPETLNFWFDFLDTTG
jgi:hypothetical protein